MLTTWDKALVPFVLAMVGLGVYFGMLTKDQAASLGSAVIPAIVAAIQAVLVFLVPNK